jgi:hypothetical protein
MSGRLQLMDNEQLAAASMPANFRPPDVRLLIVCLPIVRLLIVRLPIVRLGDQRVSWCAI